MTTEAELEAACAAWYGGRDAWILNTSEIMKGTVRRKMRAALEAAAAVRERGSTERLPSTTERTDDA